MRYELSIFTLLAFLMISCGGDGGSDPEPEPMAVVNPPSAASLVFPDNNTECNEGTIINETQNSVTFRWTEAQNADNYDISIRNLDTNGSSTTSASTNSASITLVRGTPYEWFVVSKANGTNETATSATWRFYNQGPGIENYAPFPAAAVFPVRGSTVDAGSTLVLEWEGSDVDNDLVEYEVYFGTDPAAATLLDTVSGSTLEVNVTSGQGIVYYWSILSRDSAGNTSQSDIFQFKVD